MLKYIFFQWENVTMVTFWSLKKINVLICFSFNVCILWRFDQGNLTLGWLGDLRSDLWGQNCSTENPSQWERFLIHNWALAKSFWGLTKLQFLTIRIGLAVFKYMINLINFLSKFFCSHVISVFSFLLDLRSRITKTTRLSQFLLRWTFSTQNLF